MKHPLLLFALCLLISLQAFAQDTIVTMTTTIDTVKISVKWTGSGSLAANGVELKNDFKYDCTVFPTKDGLVVVTAMGDVQLTHMSCYYNHLTGLDLINCPELIELYCSHNSLRTLDATNCTKLKELWCHKNSLFALDVTTCMELETLQCSENFLSVLDLTKCSKLNMLWCFENSLPALDLTRCSELTSLNCDNNSLTALDVTECLELMTLTCQHNHLIALDITNCTNLEYALANRQTPILPVAMIDDVKLSIKNPITFTGAKVNIENISHNGIYTGDSIVWGSARESGNVTFDFNAKLPIGSGGSFSGTATQPWTKTKSSETIQTPAQDTIVTMTTTKDSINIYVEWAGTGRITANGVELENGHHNIIPAADDGSVMLIATGDVQLTHLYCGGNSLSALDIINGAKLEHLQCGSNYLTVLDVSKCMELTNLYCHNNALTVLDVTNCTKLTELGCADNLLSALNVTKCTELKRLQCSGNSIAALDVTNYPKLKELFAYEQTLIIPEVKLDDDKLSIKNPVTFTGAEVSIENISHGGIYTGDSIVWVRERESGRVTFDFMTELPGGVEGEPFSGTVTRQWTKTKSGMNIQALLQASIVTMVTTDDSVNIYVEWTGAGSISANGVELKNSLSEVNTIFPAINGLVVMTITGDAQLTYLNCNSNSLTTLDLISCPKLDTLECFNNLLTALNLTQCPKLAKLDCGGNALTALDVTGCLALAKLQCSYNYLSVLDVAGCSALTELYCNENSLTALDLTQCRALKKLHCGWNSLTALNVTGCSALEELNCYNNLLTALNVADCPRLTSMWCSENSLTDLDVTNCPELSILHCDGNALTALNVTNCQALTVLYCADNLLADLDVTNCPELVELYCASNSLTTLNVNNCAKLLELTCAYNQLSELDVTNCPELKILYCYENSLTAINLTNCPKLNTLACFKNSLSALDVTNCTQLETLHTNYQIPVLPMVTIHNDTKLSIENPLTFNGKKVNIETISHGGTYTGSNISWEVQGESSKETFDFTTELPEGIEGKPFSGTATQPWTKNK